MKKIIILTLLTLFLATTTNLYSQKPPPPATQGQPREINSENNTKSNIQAKNNNNASQNPMPKINKIDTHKRDASAKNGHEENSNDQLRAVKDARITTYTYWLMIFTGLLVVCNIFLWFSTKKSANAAKKSIELTKQGFIATHRPKLRVHSVCLKKSDSTAKLNGGSYITHQLHYSIDNIGGSPATITKQSLAFKRLNKPLPIPSYCDPLFIGKTIACGESISDSFGVEHFLISEAEGRGLDDLYFFGYIDYRDSTQTTRRTAFCRRYIQETKRFIKVEDEDYEYSY